MHYDIIIIGGGMVGASLACALKGTHLRIALIDAAPLSPPAEDPRLIALNYNSVCLFKNISIWPELSQHAAAINEVHISHRGHFGRTRLKAHELKLNALGYVVPATYINAALTTQLNQQQHIDLFRPATLTQIEQDHTKARITIETVHGKKTLSTSILIAADGTRSSVRDLLAIPTETIDYHQQAIVTITELQRPHHQVAYERFLATGAIAMLPLSGQRVATIWTDHEKIIAELMELDDLTFLSQLQKQFGYRLGRLQRIQQRHVYPLKLIKATQQIQQRTILIGNAAHTIHPIAAQGLNLALYEIAALTDYLTQQPIETLALPIAFDYFQQQEKTIGLSHHLSWIFSANIVGFNTLRQIGITGLDMSLTAKKYVAQQAMGMGHAMPTLLRLQE